MQVPVGSLVYNLAAPILYAPIGSATNLGGVLTNLIDCTEVGTAFHTKTGLPASLGTSLCSSGLQAVATSVEAAIDAVKIDASQADGLTGTLTDVTMTKPQADYISDKISLDVKWKVGSIEIPSKIIGERE
jgi:hypothetical protein